MSSSWLLSLDYQRTSDLFQQNETDDTRNIGYSYLPQVLGPHERRLYRGRMPSSGQKMLENDLTMLQFDFPLVIRSVPYQCARHFTNQPRGIGFRVGTF